MPIDKLIETLKFLKETVFTPENIARAAALGKTLGGTLADAYELIDEMTAQAGTRSLELERRIADAGLGDIVRELQQ